MYSDEDTLSGGLPHSEIPGSTIARISPGLFAACHVLHRLSVPRHPPDALTSRLSPHPTAKTIGYGIISTKTFGKPVIPFRVQRNLDGADTIHHDGLPPHGLIMPRLWHRSRNASCGGEPGRLTPLRAQTYASTPGLSASVTYNSLLHNVRINTRSTIPGQTRWVLARDCRPQTLIFAKVPGSATKRLSAQLRCACRLPHLAGSSRRCYATPVVEVNGIEPMTSCLQSRRSPN